LIKPATEPASPTLTDKQEAFMLRVVSAMMFTHILDFMIVMPLGPRLMEIFSISPAQFGTIVSTYMFSAGGFGLVAAWFLDRFDRKTALLWLYVGFALGTVACGLAPNYMFLLMARILTGGFGGVMAATVLAVIADVIPPHRRGAAMGTVFSSFSVASVAGVPAGLFLANHLGWHAPFFLLAGLSAVITVGAWYTLPSMRGHLRQASDKPKPWKDMLAIVGHANHWNAFALTIVMTAAGFLIIPYISPSLVANVGVSNDHLPFVYLCGGAVTFFSMKWIGKLADSKGKSRVFTWVSVVAIGPMLLITHLPLLPLWVVLVVTTFFMVFTSGRMVPGMALVTATVEPRYRGGFMSINSALQQFSSGVAAMIAGAIVVKTGDGRLSRYGVVGILAMISVLTSIFLARRLKVEDVPATPGAH
jgi:predicted MFS family arabinose efflux permease